MFRWVLKELYLDALLSFLEADGEMMVMIVEESFFFVNIDLAEKIR